MRIMNTNKMYITLFRYHKYKRLETEKANVIFKDS